MDIYKVKIGLDMLSKYVESEKQEIREICKRTESYLRFDEARIRIANLNHDFGKCMLEQEWRCSCAKVTARRFKSSLIIEWEFDESVVGDPNEWGVFATMHHVELEPDPQAFDGQLVANTKGNNHLKLNLAEGDSYFFNFMFAPAYAFEDRFTDKSIEVEIIRFHANIPISAANRMILDKAMGKAPSPQIAPEKGIEKELQSYFDRKDALDRMRSEAIERIKRKNLSPQEEQDEIERYDEFVESKREKFNL